MTISGDRSSSLLNSTAPTPDCPLTHAMTIVDSVGSATCGPRRTGESAVGSPVDPPQFMLARTTSTRNLHGTLREPEDDVRGERGKFGGEGGNTGHLGGARKLRRYGTSMNSEETEAALK